MAMTGCALETEGYRVVFHLLKWDAAHEYADGRVEIILAPELGGLSISSVPTFVATSDLRDLAAYLERHIVRLQADSGGESSVFVSLELGFQVQALAGEVGEDEEGEFTLRFQVNVGQREGCARTYAGAEAVVSVGNIRRFTASLDSVLNEIPSAR